MYGYIGLKCLSIVPALGDLEPLGIMQGKWKLPSNYAILHFPFLLFMEEVSKCNIALSISAIHGRSFKVFWALSGPIHYKTPVLSAIVTITDQPKP